MSTHTVIVCDGEGCSKGLKQFEVPFELTAERVEQHPYKRHKIALHACSEACFRTLLSSGIVANGLQLAPQAAPAKTSAPYRTPG